MKIKHPLKQGHSKDNLGAETLAARNTCSYLHIKTAHPSPYYLS